ncbi:PREDICTED: cytochrome P450 71B34-like [Fragaria vesca subsp. vesca]|uniref:cytochrome P450 71B34-like n=1 Tax=Fragaria vesca subsp. vesca TaxID=101020 RepID=UPI0002C3087F|nr:PREDICTED: cytochrome P450 71B34-like [Fragaria vesca subsp. vesca]
MGLNTLLQILWLPFLLLLPLLLLLNKNKKPPKHYPPSPPKLPIIGNLHQFTQSGSSPHQNLWRLSKKFGPVMLLHLGRIPTLVISSAEAAKQVLKDNDLNCCSRPSSSGSRKLTYNYLDMGFAPYGEYWREIRKICVLELFSVKRVHSYRAIREEEVAKMISSISKESASNSCVDLTEKLFAVMGSIAFRVILGTSFEGSSFEHDRFHQVLHEVEIMLAGFTAADFFPSKIGYLIDRISGKQRQFERVSGELHRFFQQVIDDHLKPGRIQQEHDDIVGVLLKIVKEQTGFGAAHLGHDNIKALLVNLFLGGIDTGAITMLWAMAELAKNPRLMKKAQDEVRSVVGNKGNVSESDTEELPYLKMIVKESLRLHPPAPLILPRETMAPFKVLGYDVEPKTLVMINDWAISRDPEFWKDPEEFIPERFDGSSVDFKGQHFEFLPFGAGRRVCPGIYMATTTVELGLANLLYSFDWKLPEGMKEEDINMEETTGELALTISKKTALNLVPVKFSG